MIFIDFNIPMYLVGAEHPHKIDAQRLLERCISDNERLVTRYRFWGRIEELEGRYLRVITLADKRTIHNAFPDRGFKP